MELIRSFCGFSLAACAAQLLLPEGSLRKTAALAIGLMTSLLWLNGLLHAELPDISMHAGASALAATGTGIDQDSACGELISQAASAAAGCDVRVLWDEGGIAGIQAFTDDPDAAWRVADALHVDPGCVTVCGTR